MSGMRDVAYTTERSDVFEMVPPTAMAILDVGCSNGALGASLRSALPGRQVVGIERDPAFAAQAASQLDQVIQTDVNDFDWSGELSDHLFDCVIFADVLEHLLDPQRHLTGARRHLRPGGSVVISLPNIRHISALYSIYVSGTFPRRDRGIFDRTHLHWFTLRDAKTFVADAGMRIESITYNLRMGDKGGGLLNRIAGRLLDPINDFAPIREFLSYQFCLRAVLD